MALTEHVGGVADALQRNIVVAPPVAPIKLAKTIPARSMRLAQLFRSRGRLRLVKGGKLEDSRTRTGT